MFDERRPGPDYTLRWPPQLFVSELRTLADDLEHGRASDDDIEWLLTEAFIADKPADDYRAFTADASDHPWWSTAAGSRRDQFLQRLIKAAPRFDQEVAPRPYFTARQAPAAVRPAPGAPDHEGARRSWVVAVHQFQQRGYLDRVAPHWCVDGDDDQVQPDEALNTVVSNRLGARPGDRFWPLDPQAWDGDTFFSLVEIFHDLVARPRSRWYHSFSHCGWHYSNFVVDPAQILYRWTVNRLLARHVIPLQLAKTGEDYGRLVHNPADGRDALLAAALDQPASIEQDKVAHAVALFRSRQASVEDRRSACVALAGVLEARRHLLKQELLPKDEGALFQIANQFAIRHHRADQHAEYDEAYLDWIYWWYLATVELSNRLIARNQPGG